MLLDLIYFFLSFLHISLKNFISLRLYQIIPSLFLRDSSTKASVDLWLEAMLLLVILLSLMDKFHALVRGRRATSLNVLLHIMRHCWVVKFALNMVVQVFAWVLLLWLWRLLSRFLRLLLGKCVICLLAVGRVRS